MKLIIYFGHTGTTQKAALMLQEMLSDCIVIDGRKKHKLDYSLYSSIIFGVNIHADKLNKSFLKTYKRLQKKGLLSKAELSGFIIAGNEHQRTAYMNLLREVLPEDAYIGFFGGEFNPNQAKGITKSILKVCINQFLEQNLPLPSLNKEAMEDFVTHIK